MKVGGVLLLLASCASEEEPPPSLCSQLPTSVALGYTGGAAAGYVPTLGVGGHISASLKCGTSGNLLSSPPGPFEIDDGGGPAVRATVTEQGVVSFDAVAAGMNTITVSGKWVIDTSFEARAAEVASATLFPGRTTDYLPPVGPLGPWAVAPGTYTFAATLRDDAGSLLFGLQPTISFTNNGVTTTDPIVLTTVGDYYVDVSAGSFSTTVPFTVTDVVDTITLADPSRPLDAPNRNLVCFTAFDRGQLVLGLDWTIDWTGMSYDDAWNNCVDIWLGAEQVGQTVQLTATTAGLTKTFDIPVQ